MELLINLYKMLVYLTQIMTSLEQDNYMLIINFRKMNNKFEFIYEIAKENDKENPVVMVSAWLNEIPYSDNLEQISQEIVITVENVVNVLSQSCYYYPYMTKFCELLEEYDQLGKNELSDQDFEKIKDITVQYGSEIAQLNKNQEYHLSNEEKQKMIVKLKRYFS